MADADRGVELYTIAGVGDCLYCGLNVLGTPDNPPEVGSVVFCGGCAGIHLLDVVEMLDDLVPCIEKPTPAERLELLKRPDVQAVRDAYQLDQMEARMSRASRKDRRPSAPRTAGKVRPGLNRLEAKGPDAR